MKGGATGDQRAAGGDPLPAPERLLAGLLRYHASKALLRPFLTLTHTFTPTHSLILTLLRHHASTLCLVDASSALSSMYHH